MYNTTMPTKIANGLRIVTWAEISKEVRAVNPVLAEMIDAINPNENYPLIEVTLGYGEKMFEGDQIRLPAKGGKMKPLSDEGLVQVAPFLKYATRPLGLQLKKSSEMFLEFEDRVVPLDMIREGEFVSLLEMTGFVNPSIQALPWSLTSGARSAFMVPKITDARSHNRLKAEFMFHRGPPTGLADHWHVFRAIANAAFDEFEWASKTLLFSGAWFDKEAKTHQSPEWLRFYTYLMQLGIQKMTAEHNALEQTTAWEDFSGAIRQKNLKPGPYLLDTVKHLIGIALGDGLGFVPEDGRESALPGRLIELAYSETYQSEYAPILMYPSRLSAEGPGRTLYYSMGMPSLSAGSPSIRKAPSVITELREVKTLMRLLQGLLKVEQYASLPGLREMFLEYYHSEVDPFGEIVNSADIAASDDILKARLSSTRFMRKEFPTHGQFLRGCISIQMKDKTT